MIQGVQAGNFSVEQIIVGNVPGRWFGVYKIR